MYPTKPVVKLINEPRPRSGSKRQSPSLPPSQILPFLIRKIGKGIPIVPNDTLPGGKPKVSFAILHDIARDTTGAVGSGYLLGFHKIWVIIRQFYFRLLWLACVVFWQACFLLSITGGDENEWKKKKEDLCVFVRFLHLPDYFFQSTMKYLFQAVSIVKECKGRVNISKGCFELNFDGADSFFCILYRSSRIIILKKHDRKVLPVA